MEKKECVMKVKDLFRGAVAALCLAFGLLFGTVGMSAYGLEVPKDVQEVHIPVTLPVDAAIAGGEIEFSQSAGLTYLRFEPAVGVHNPVKATVEDKTYVGFFSSDNVYQPSAGNLLMGDLVFGYTGDIAEQVTLSKIKLHTKIDTGSGAAVDTQVIDPGTVIPVSRLGDSDNGGNGNDDPGGGDNGNDNNGGGTNNGGTSGVNAGGSGGSGSGGTNAAQGAAGTAVADAAGTPSGTSGNAGTDGSSGSQNAGIGSVDIGDITAPLAGPITPGLAEQALPLWLIWLLAAFIAVILILFLLFWFRRRQQGAQTTEESFGTHMRGVEDVDHAAGDSISHSADDKPGV
jgi:hypothetical protein